MFNDMTLTLKLSLTFNSAACPGWLLDLERGDASLGDTRPDIYVFIYRFLCVEFHSIFFLNLYIYIYTTYSLLLVMIFFLIPKGLPDIKGVVQRQWLLHSRFTHCLCDWSAQTAPADCFPLWFSRCFQILSIMATGKMAWNLGRLVPMPSPMDPNLRTLTISDFADREDAASGGSWRISFQLDSTWKAVFIAVLNTMLK